MRVQCNLQLFQLVKRHTVFRYVQRDGVGVRVHPRVRAGTGFKDVGFKLVAFEHLVLRVLDGDVALRHCLKARIFLADVGLPHHELDFELLGFHFSRRLKEIS